MPPSLSHRERGRIVDPSGGSCGIKSLMKAGPSVLVCKKGGQGSHIFTEEGDCEMPALQADVVDNTGAGDVSNAGFLAGLFLERSLEESAHFGTVIASKSVTG
jgi:sugar/nucleoside kinase (ribokinase family)